LPLLVSRLEEHRRQSYKDVRRALEDHAVFGVRATITIAEYRRAANYSKPKGRQAVIRWLHRYFATVSPAFIDGLLYAMLAWFLYNQGYFSGDEAAKYIDPVTKFWLNWVIGSGAVICTAVKMFRSTTFAEHVENKKKEGGTAPPFVVNK
jgi:hypothetical protein